MKKYSNMSYTDKIKWRTRILWCVLVLMLVYMVVISELGGGDSRIMTDLANKVSRIIFFGGMAYVIYRIVHNQNLLKDRSLLKEQMLREYDERNQYLHDKSGGIVLDALLICILFITLTASLFNMAAFYTAYVILMLAVIIKAVTYFILSREP